MEFRVPGPLVVVRAGQELPVAGGKTILAGTIPRATQLRLPGFSLDALGIRARDIYASPAVMTRVDDGYLRDPAVAVTGKLGGQVGVAPRVYLKKLVADVLDRADQFADWDPHQHYALTLRGDELTEVERGNSQFWARIQDQPLVTRLRLVARAGNSDWHRGAESRTSHRILRDVQVVVAVTGT